MYGEFEDVVVTAQYAPTDSKQAMHVIRTITRETIERQGATNLEQLLSQDISIRINQDLVLGSSMSLLGIQGQNVKIMIDGVSVVGRLDGNIDLSQINLHNVERVEIVEGPMSVSYGTDALAGVINLITKKSQLNRYHVGAVQQIETRGEWSSLLELGTQLNKNWSFRLQGGRDAFDGFSEDSLRNVPWNPKEQWYTDGLLRYNFLDDHSLRYTVSWFDEEVKNLGEIRRPVFKPYAFDEYYYTRRFNHALAHEGTVWNNFYWQTTVGYNQFRRQKNTYRVELEEDTRAEVAGEQDTIQFNGLTARSVLASKFSDFPLNFQVGVDLKQEASKGDRIIDEEAEEEGSSSIGDYALFGSLRYQLLESLMLEAGLRAAYNTRYDAPLIPSFHLRYNFHENWTLRASYAKGFRSPGLKELFFNFIDINHYIVGNPNLKAEQSDNIQLNAQFKKRMQKQQVSGSVQAFYNNIQDKIELFEFQEINGEIVPVTDGTTTLQYAYFNQAAFKTQGINVRLGYEWGDVNVEGGLGLIGYYNPLHEEYADVASFTYATEWSGKVSYIIPKIETTFSAFVRGNDRLITYYPVTEKGETLAAQRYQDGFTLLDISLDKNFWKDRFSLTAGVHNLLDVRRSTVIANGGSSGSSPVNPGRSYFVRLAFNLSWN